MLSIRKKKLVYFGLVHNFSDVQETCFMTLARKDCLRFKANLRNEKRAAENLDQIFIHYLAGLIYTALSVHYVNHKKYGLWV